MKINKIKPQWFLSSVLLRQSTGKTKVCNRPQKPLVSFFDNTTFGSLKKKAVTREQIVDLIMAVIAELDPTITINYRVWLKSVDNKFKNEKNSVDLDYSQVIQRIRQELLDPDSTFDIDIDKLFRVKEASIGEKVNFIHQPIPLNKILNLLFKHNSDDEFSDIKTVRACIKYLEKHSKPL